MNESILRDMATGSRCSACEKGPGAYHCTGCNEYFCSKDFKYHRQRLAGEMDGLVEDRNNLQEKLINESQSEESHGSPLSQSEGWQKITDQFKKTSQEIVELQEADDYVEHDLMRIRKTIHRLNEDHQRLIQSPTLELHTDYSDLVTSNFINSVEKKTKEAAQVVEESQNEIQSKFVY